MLTTLIKPPADKIEGLRARVARVTAMSTTPMTASRSQHHSTNNCARAASQLVTRSSRHTVMSSHGHVITQSTRHITKPPQCRAVQFGYLGLMSLYHSTDD